MFFGAIERPQLFHTPGWVNRRDSVPSRQRPEALGTERIQADGQAVQARLVERPRMLGQLDSVGRHGQILDPAGLRKHPHEGWKVSAQERFTASKAYLVGSKLHEDGDEFADLLERQQAFAGKPDVLLLWHAVLTAEVAAVRD